MTLVRFALVATLAAACSSPARARAHRPYALHEIDGATVDLAREAKTAHDEGLTPYLWISATWCGPCRALKASLSDARMQDALAGTYIIHVDLDAARATLDAAGFHPEAIPVFYGLKPDGKPDGRKIDGGAWGDNVPSEMAPPLKKFFAGGA